MHRQHLRLARIAVAAVTIAVAPPRAGADAGTSATPQVPSELTTINVEDSSLEHSYTLPNASTGTRTDTPLLETPVAVQVIPRQVLDDRQTLSVQEAIKNVSGVQDANQFYDQFQLRGFVDDSRLRNGLYMTNTFGGVDMAFVDHIEVAKGPSSMLYGRIEPGGIINVITKQPQSTSALGIEQQVGSWNEVRTTADATGKISDSGTLLYRLIAVYDKGDSFIDNVHHDNDAVAATLAWKPNARFEGNLQFEHYDTKYIESFNGIGGQIPIIGNSFAKLPRSFSDVDPVLWSNFPMKVNRNLYAYEWAFAFDDHWRLTNRLAYTDHTETQSIFYGTFDGTTTVNQWYFAYEPGWKRSTLSTNVDLTGEFHSGAIKHTLLVGADLRRDKNDEPGSDGAISGIAPLNIYNPVFGNNVATLQATANADSGNILWRNRIRQVGFYVQDQIELDQSWNLLLGVRHDHGDQAYSSVYGTRDYSACYPNCTGYPIVPQPTDVANSPRVGVLYKVSSQTSVYASWSRSFGQSYGQAAFDGSTVGPEKGVQFELGAKASLLDGKASGSATVFDLCKRDVVQSDPVHAGYLIDVGEICSRGLELDLAGQLTEHLSVIGSYTYDDAIITRDVTPTDPTQGTINTQGNRLGNVPLHAASLWAKYDTAPDAADGWSLGAGIYLDGRREGDNLNSFQIPGYIRVDAMLAYRTKVGGKKISAQVNVNNLLDAAYFESAGTAGGSSGGYYGPPRNVLASVRLDL